MTDELILEVCNDVFVSFSRQCKRLYIQRRRLERGDVINHLYIEIKELINDSKYVGQGALELRKVCFKLIRKFIKSNETESIGVYGNRNDYDFTKNIPLIESVQITDRLLDSNTKLRQWCKTRKDRLAKNIDSRVCAYLHLVEEWSVQQIADYFNRSWQAINCCIHVITTKKKRMTLKQHDVVLLKMDNPFFNNMLGRIKEITDYGALVLVESHSYPQRKLWELRCTTDEMIYIGTLDAKELNRKVTGEEIAGGTTRKAHSADIAKYQVVAEASSELCPKCQGFMVRTGSCLTCQSCGESSGGCG